MMFRVYSREAGYNGKCVNKMSATDTILQSITLRINEDTLQKLWTSHYPVEIITTDKIIQDLDRKSKSQISHHLHHHDMDSTFALVGDG